MAYNAIRAFHNRRRTVFAVYARDGYDRARDIAKACKSRQWQRGLVAELFFYHTFQHRYKLTPAIDAGEKADFSGFMKRKGVRIDVTTSLGRKSAEDYHEASQKAGMVYHVALVDPDKETCDLMPLAFPTCPDCNKMAHHVVFIVPSDRESHSMGGLSDDQRVLRYCPHCGEFDERKGFTYIMPHLDAERSALDDLTNEVGIYTPKQAQDIWKQQVVRTVQFFEKQSRLQLSGLAENTYVVTDPRDGDGYWAGGLHWRHPLARSLDNEIEVHYGAWA